MSRAEAFRLLDTVALRVTSGRWPAGTIGTVVEALDRGAVIEITDERGHTLELLSLPYGALAGVEPPAEQQRLSV